MRIGLIDTDSKMANFALMRISSYHKERGDEVVWADTFSHYDRVYQSKVFTFSQDDQTIYYADEIVRGGTGYDVKSRLPEEIENHCGLDYSIYPNCNYSIQFFSRGCIRSCPFCIVREKEGYLRSVAPMNYNPKGEWVEVLDNNFFANPNWRNAIEELQRNGQPVNLHGVDIRLMNEEQAEALSTLKLKQNVKIAWDLPEIDLEPKLREVVKYIKPYRLTCYVLVGFNSTIKQDMRRLEILRELGITPFVMIYRDPVNRREPNNYCKDLARWVNKPQLFKSVKFEDYEPRKDFKCKEYLR